MYQDSPWKNLYNLDMRFVFYRVFIIAIFFYNSEIQELS